MFMKLTRLFASLFVFIPLFASSQDVMSKISEAGGDKVLTDMQKAALNELADKGYVIQVYEITDPELEFEDYKDKHSKVELKKDKIKLESKNKKHFVVAVTDVRKANPQNCDIMYACPIKFSGFDDNHKSGIVFNYRNTDNFHALVLDKKNYYYLIRERGDSYIEQRGAYKSKKRDNVVTPAISVKNRKLSLIIDGLEMAEVKMSKPLRSRKYGFYTDGESSIEVPGPMIFATFEREDEDGYDDEDDDDGGRRRKRSRDYDDED